MYNRENYRKALEERDKCDLDSKEWRLCQSKVQSIATVMVLQEIARWFMKSSTSFTA